MVSLHLVLRKAQYEALFLKLSSNFAKSNSYPLGLFLHYDAHCVALIASPKRRIASQNILISFTLAIQPRAAFTRPVSFPI